MYIEIGFTGHRTGMTTEQKMSLFWLLQTFFEHRQDEIIEFHHGDCIGADAEAHVLARLAGDYKIVVHPPANPALRAWCEGDEIREPEDYLVRDRNIVNETELLLAAVQLPVKPNSGTWYTYKYAQDRQKRAWRL